MSSNEKVLTLALVAAAAFGVWYWYKNSALTAANIAAAQNGGSPS